MKYRLSIHAQDVMTARAIKEEWIAFVVDTPSREIVVSDIELHLFATIIENDNRCLKVVVNPQKKLVITAYFDRKMRKKGC